MYRFVGFNEDMTGGLEMQSAMVNWPTVSKWLGNCQSKHIKTSYEQSVQPPPTGFRVIDTERKCVMDAPPECEYATLSYVWGDRKSAGLEATTDNIAALQEEGSLLHAEIPLTIQDAMIACTHLGIRYLWADRLCIPQDKAAAEEALQQINAMAGIYGRSLVTLVAMAGSNASHGLPGVSTVKRNYRISFSTQGVYVLRQTEGYHDLVHDSNWATRGWTFQEALLSPRMLLFSDYGVFFECLHDKAIQDEDPNVRLHRGSDQPRFHLSSLYQNLVKAFSQRSLSFESDILRAFSGVLHAKYRKNHYFGLPFRKFNSAILWIPDRAISWTAEMELYRPRNSPEGSVFPSWSWASVTEEVEFLYAAHLAPLVAWAIPASDSGRSTLQILPHGSGEECKPKDDMCFALGIAVAWKKGCFRGPIPAALNFNATWAQYESIIQPRWSTFDAFYDDVHDMVNGIPRDVKIKFPASLVDRVNGAPGMAYTPFLRLQPVYLTEADIISRRPKLRDERGNTIAWYVSYGADEDKLSTNAPTITDEGLYLDVIALSMCMGRLSDLQWPHLDEYENGNAYGRENIIMRDCAGAPLYQGKGETDACILKVYLMVLETQHGISRRVGIAEAFLNVWADANPQFGSFIIE
ncbi:hypothetical protein AWENTII_009516 [Aspergillus wentii]